MDAPHHFRKDDEWEYREGVVTDIPAKDNKGSWVDIGLMNVKILFTKKTFIFVLIQNKNLTQKKIQVDKKLQSGIRVTVKKVDGNINKLRGLVVSPDTPRTQNSIYWGYQVRYASSFRKILSGKDWIIILTLI